MRHVGEKNHSAKLTDVSVLAIRTSFNKGDRIKDLAIAHNASPQAIIGVVYGRAWKHVVSA